MPPLKWWKWITIPLMVYVIYMGLMGKVPRLPILNETVRNLYFHVPMWFGMIFLFGASVWFSIQYLRTGNIEHDVKAASYVDIGIVFGILGLLTGMLWAKFTWGEYWSNDPKQNASAIGMMIYFGYLLLRGSLSSDRDKARISSVYSIFAFAILIPLIYVLPRFTDSLHPGNGGNPGFNPYDQARYMRPVFYPAVLGWTLTGFWIGDLIIRYKLIVKNRIENG
jgi:heme exporter protein C